MRFFSRQAPEPHDKTAAIAELERLLKYLGDDVCIVNGVIFEAVGPNGLPRITVQQRGLLWFSNNLICGSGSMEPVAEIIIDAPQIAIDEMRRTWGAA